MKKIFLGLMISLACLGVRTTAAQEIALIDSDSTRYFFERRGYSLCGTASNHIGALEYERYYRGWLYVLQGQKSNGLAGLAVPADDFAGKFVVLKDEKDKFDITEAELKRRGVKVLILSNLAAMSVEETREIKQWVLGGGNLIATYGSGYKDIIENPHDPEGADPLKSQKGSTGGLHELWHDPWTKAFGTQSFNPPPGVDIRIFKDFGPTDVPDYAIPQPPAPLPLLSYGAEANLLVPRPEHYRDALAFLSLDPNPDPRKAYPAILLTRASRGKVVYFSYAPEFIVALAFNLAGHCPADGNYPPASPDWDLNPPATQVVGPVAADFPNWFVGTVSANFGSQINANRVTPQLKIMKRTIDFMLTGN